MSLSVSGFPEPTRGALGSSSTSNTASSSPSSSTGVTDSSLPSTFSTGEGASEGVGRTILMSSPRLRGLFGGGSSGGGSSGTSSSGTSAKKPTPGRSGDASSWTSYDDDAAGSYGHAPHPHAYTSTIGSSTASTSTSHSNVNYSNYSTSNWNTNSTSHSTSTSTSDMNSSPRPSHSPLSFSPSLEPLSAQKYDLDTPPVFDFETLGKGLSNSSASTSSFGIGLGASLSGNIAPRRPHLPPVPTISRKPTSSPVRLGPSLTRLDIGAAGPRSPTMNIPNKLPMPSVVVEEWVGVQKEKEKGSETPTVVGGKRPLPVVPSPSTTTSGTGGTMFGSNHNHIQNQSHTQTQTQNHTETHAFAHTYTYPLPSSSTPPTTFTSSSYTTYTTSGAEAPKHPTGSANANAYVDASAGSSQFPETSTSTAPSNSKTNSRAKTSSGPSTPTIGYEHEYAPAAGLDIQSASLRSSPKAVSDSASGFSPSPVAMSIPSTSLLSSASTSTSTSVGSTSTATSTSVMFLASEVSGSLAKQRSGRHQNAVASSSKHHINAIAGPSNNRETGYSSGSPSMGLASTTFVSANTAYPSASASVSVANANSYSNSASMVTSTLTSALPSHHAPSTSPISKVFITQPPQHQGQGQGQYTRTFKTSLTMRYQPLVGEAPTASSSSSTTDSTSLNAHVSSPTNATSRPLPLPLIAPKAIHAPSNTILGPSASISTSPLAASPIRVGPAGARGKHVKNTSANIITGISTTPSRGGSGGNGGAGTTGVGYGTPKSASASPMGLSRSPFDNVSPSWVRQHENTSPLPLFSALNGPKSRAGSRARSHSRLSSTRRERDMEREREREREERYDYSRTFDYINTTRSSPATSRMPSPVSVRTVMGTSTNMNMGRTQSRPRAATTRALPSPTSNSINSVSSGSTVRPLKQSATIDFIPPGMGLSGQGKGSLALQMHIADSPLEMGGLGVGMGFSKVQSPVRTKPPDPPVGPKAAKGGRGLKVAKPASTATAASISTTVPVSGPPPMPFIVTNQIAPSRDRDRGHLSTTTATPVTGGTSTTTTSGYSINSTPPTTAPGLSDGYDDTDAYSLDAPLHSHPLEMIADSSESMSGGGSVFGVHPLGLDLDLNTDGDGDGDGDGEHAPQTPVEVFIDDQDLSTLSRSPSPIRYARPDSRGNLSSDDDVLGADDGGSSSSEGESEDGGDESPGRVMRRRRKQLRAYRNSYRPREGGEPPHIPYLRRSPSPMEHQRQQQQQHLLVPPTQDAAADEKENEKEKEKEKAKRKKKKARSYFSEYISGTSSFTSTLASASATSASASVPATRASSPERKSRSRQPRKLANAMSLALDVRGRNGARNTNGGGSPSPRRTTMLSDSFGSVSNDKKKLPTSWGVGSGSWDYEDGEVLDIGRSSPLMLQQQDADEDTLGMGMVVGTETGTGTPSSQTSSARSSAKVGWVQTVTRKRSELSGEGGGSTEQVVLMHEMDGSDFAYTPSTLTSTTNNGKTASVSYYVHRRAESVQAEYPSPLIGQVGKSEKERDSERYVIPSAITTTITSNANNKPRSSDPSIVSSGASNRTPASSLSNHSSSFAAFGIISRHKKSSKQTLAVDSQTSLGTRGGSVSVKESVSGSTASIGPTFHGSNTTNTKKKSKSKSKSRRRGVGKGDEEEWGDEWTGGPTGLHRV